MGIDQAGPDQSNHGGHAKHSPLFDARNEFIHDGIDYACGCCDGEVYVHLYFGCSSTCPHCAAAKPFCLGLPGEHPWLILESLQVDGDNEANRQLLTDLAAGIGETLQSVPAFLYAERLDVGWDSDATTGRTLERQLVAYHDCLVAAVGRGVGDPGFTCVADGSFEIPVLGALTSLPVLTVVLAGLDAVNPCALSVLLFLLSLLVGARDRRRMLLVGGTFCCVRLSREDSLTPRRHGG